MTTSTTIHEVIVIGWDDFVHRVAHELLAAGLTVKVVVNDPLEAQQVKAAFGDQVPVLVSELSDFRKMESVGIDKAQVILVNLSDDRDKLVYVVKLRRRFPNTKIVAPVTNPRLNESFVTAAEVLPLSKDEVSAKIFASYLFERDVAEYLSDLLSPARRSDDRDIQQQLLWSGHSYCGRKYGDVFIELKKTYNAVLIGMSRKKQGGSSGLARRSSDPVGSEYKLHKNPPDDIVLQENDYLIMVVDGDAAERMGQEIFGSEPG